MGEDEVEEEVVEEGEEERSFGGEVVESNAPRGLACSVSLVE